MSIGRSASYGNMEPSVQDARLNHILEALQECPRLRTRQLAAMVDLHPSHLQHLFKKHVGITIGAYSMELRLQLARVLLTRTHKSIKEVRHEVGIPNGANFVRYFKIRFLMTPSGYRRSFQNSFDEQIAILTNENPLKGRTF